MSRTVVGALSRVVAHRSSRRGLLARSALGATALAVAPVAFTMRPVSAHHAICRCAGSACACGDKCCDGYTDFCCKLTGENLCPPNTVVAGWWKADGSGFCDVGDSARPRYYLDCNHLCDDGCGCGRGGVCGPSCTTAECRCLEGCGSRRVDCVRFRYGQCNQDIACVGPIACRIVTCVPPWKWDESCDDTPITDNSTGTHDRACLHDGFTDLAPNAFYIEAVDWAFRREITTGYNDDIFGPHEPVLRWHMAVFLWRYLQQPEPAQSSHFSDVGEQWYADAVNSMAEAGIIFGTDQEPFGSRNLNPGAQRSLGDDSTARKYDPDAALTRGQVVAALWQMAGRPLPSPELSVPLPEAVYLSDLPHPFDDVEEGSYYRQAAHWAAQTGLTDGVGERTFGGELLIDRAQAVTLLHRYQLLSELQDSEDSQGTQDAHDSHDSQSADSGSEALR